MRRIHAHPITIAGNLGRVMFLVIIPVVRGFASALYGDFAGWLSGAWLDILIFTIMVAIAVLRWYRVTYLFDVSHLDISTGLVLRKSMLIPWDKIVTVSTYRKFFLRPIRVVQFRADTIGGSAKDSDFSILLRPEHAGALMGHVRECECPDGNCGYSPKTSSILALSLLTSNSFASIVFMATLVSQAGKLLGQEVSDLFIGTMESVARTFAFGIPPAAAMLAYLLLLGWLLGFWRTFARHKNMTVSRTASSLNITGGLFSHREYRVEYGNIAFVDIRQSLITKCLRLYSLYICVAGYGKQKSDLSCIIPTESGDAFDTARRQLFPEFNPAPRRYYHQGGAMRFISLPVYLCLILAAGVWVLIQLYPDWSRFIRFVGLMLLVPALVFLAVCILDYRSAGFAFDGKYYTFRYSKSFYLHTVIIPAEAVVLVELKQSFFQRFGGKCDVLLYTRSERRAVHRCRGLKLAQMQALFMPGRK